MASRTLGAQTVVTPKDLAASPPRWSWAHYLALVAIPILAWEVWTVVAWLADGPYQVTEYRTPGSTNWWAAHILEGLTIAVAIPVAIYVIRGVRRERRLTFDAMFCLAGATLVNNDLGVNVVYPTWLPTANFVNLNNMCGHMPFVVNPDCGRAPDPLLFFFALDAFGLLAVAIVAEKLVRWARSRWPHLSTAQTIGLVLLGGLAVDLALEPMAIALGLWTFASPRALSLLDFGSGLRYALPELIAGPCFLALPAAVRVLKDDQGRTIVERGLQHLSPRRRTGVSLLALYGLFQLIAWIPGSLPITFLGPYQASWPELPSYLNTGICDEPGTLKPGEQGTRYGPCPGSPDYRMPGRHSLPGESP